MSDVLFKASLQYTLNPEVGTFNNVDNKEGIFTLEDGEYYLTNNTDSSYRVYYPTKDITYSVGFTTIEFDVNYNNNGSSLIHPCLLFNGDNYDENWHGFGVVDSTLYFAGGLNMPNQEIVTSPSTWLHVKCIFDYNPDQSIVHIYIDNVEVTNFTISNIYGIKYIEILGDHDGLALIPDAKIKNITISSSKKHYLDTVGLTSLWSKIKSLFATKSDLTNYYTKKQIDILLKKVIVNQKVLGGAIYDANIDEYNNETEQTMKTVSAVVEPTSVNAYTIVENSDTVEEL